MSVLLGDIDAMVNQMRANDSEAFHIPDSKWWLNSGTQTAASTPGRPHRRPNDRVDARTTAKTSERPRQWRIVISNKYG